METNQEHQNKLDRFYKYIMGLIVLAISVAIVGTFIQIYAINVKIKTEVAQIQAAQLKNRNTTNDENNVVLGYLECIATIPPEGRTQAIIHACVTQAKKSNAPFISKQ